MNQIERNNQLVKCLDDVENSITQYALRNYLGDARNNEPYNRDVVLSVVSDETHAKIVKASAEFVELMKSANDEVEHKTFKVETQTTLVEKEPDTAKPLLFKAGEDGYHEFERPTAGEEAE